MGEGESSGVVWAIGRWSAVHGPDACGKAKSAFHELESRRASSPQPSPPEEEREKLRVPARLMEAMRERRSGKSLAEEREHQGTRGLPLPDDAQGNRRGAAQQSRNPKDF